eukprot:150171-Prymnesium_polylepis.1
MLCTCSPRGSPVSQEAESATARKSPLATPNFLHVHTPASTLPPRPNFENVPWGSDRAEGGRCATRACCVIVLNFCKANGFTASCVCGARR